MKTPEVPLRLDSHSHLVHLHEDDSTLASSAGAFLLPAISEGGAGIVIATPAHRSAVVAFLQEHGIDTGTAANDGSLRLLDSEQILAQVIVDDRLDHVQFDRMIARLIEGRAPRTLWLHTSASHRPDIACGSKYATMCPGRRLPTRSRATRDADGGSPYERPLERVEFVTGDGRKGRLGETRGLSS